jgi:hypothetical protein
MTAHALMTTGLTNRSTDMSKTFTTFPFHRVGHPRPSTKAMQRALAAAARKGVTK